MQELKARQRVEQGKRVKALRHHGMLPGVLYGQGMKTSSIEVSFLDFESVWRAAGESTLIELFCDEKKYNVLIHDVAFDPLRGKPIHADFYAVRMDRPIRVKIPIAFVGESGAVKNEAGVLVKVVHELEVEALPAKLPHQLDVDLTQLDHIGSHLTVRDLIVSSDVTIEASPDEIIAVVEAPKSVDELVVEEGSGELQDVKTEREEKMAKKAQEEEENNRSTAS